MLTIHRSTETDEVLQEFGANNVCCKLQDNGIFPTMPFKLKKKKDLWRCPRGYKEFYPFIGLKGHDGTDRGGWYGEPVYFSASFNGWIKKASDQDGGIGVEVVSDQSFVACKEPGCKEEHYIKARYWHLSRVIGQEGNQVRMGACIGRMGSSGASTGTHLHESYLWCDKNGVVIHKDNGFNGAFDPKKYFTNTFFVGTIKEELSLLDYTIMNLTRVARILQQFL